MSKIISKTKLLTTTAICAISVCANTVKAEEISILDILNNSTTKSPNISWEQVTSAGTDTIQIGDEYYKYTWTSNDTNRGKYAERQENKLDGLVISADFMNILHKFAPDSGVFYGGAFYNEDGLIESITGDFIGNSISLDENEEYVPDNSYDMYQFSTKGGAIANSGTIKNITGDFIGNKNLNHLTEAVGGAIYSWGII